MKKILVLVGLILVFNSCATRDEVVYFQPAESVNGMQNIMDYEPIIEENDVLRINVSSRNEEMVHPFQINSGQGSSSGGGQNLSLTGYLVDPEGYIQFPVIGSFKVAGKKRTDVEQELQAKIRTMAKDAVVSVRIVNFNITVLGEFNTRGRIPIDDGRISLPQLIAMAGDISYDGDRENIHVFREINGIRSHGIVDITSADVFNNPYFYLKQNDIVYVEPTYRKVKSAGFITSYTGIFSLIGSIVGLIFLFSR